jgi:hypothetical protein
MNNSPIKRISSKKYRGAGDIVAQIAEPIAHASDRILKTKIRGCGSCQRRRAKLNKWLPFE